MTTPGGFRRVSMLLALLIFLGSAMPMGSVAAKSDPSGKPETIEQYTPADGGVCAAATETPTVAPTAPDADTPQPTPTDVATAAIMATPTS